MLELSDNPVGVEVAVNASVAPPASPYVTFRVADDHDRAETHADPCGLYPDPPNVPAPVERVQTGQFNWRGGEGSQTTFLDDDLREGESIPDYRCPIPENCVPCCDRGQTVIAPARTKPATGLVYMVNRYYEPETGRFTQADPLPFTPLQLTLGQQNRWVYGTNDPINLTDALGLCAIAATGVLGLGGLIETILGVVFGSAVATLILLLLGVIAIIAVVILVMSLIDGSEQRNNCILTEQAWATRLDGSVEWDCTYRCPNFSRLVVIPSGSNSALFECPLTIPNIWGR